MITNRNGNFVEEAPMFQSWSDQATNAERDEAIKLILQHLDCHIVRTNATKHGNTELVLRTNEKSNT